MLYSKSEWRRRTQMEIAALPEDYILTSDEKIYFLVTQQTEFISARNIFIYHSVKKEPDTHRIMRAAISMGKTVALPYCCNGGIMEARIIGSLEVLRPSIHQIPAPPDTAQLLAPEELDLVIVPALTYDLDGYRLGQGGGYYDRYLTKTSAFTIGLTRERLIQEKLPRAPHDIPVSSIITETTRYNRT